MFYFLSPSILVINSCLGSRELLLFDFLLVTDLLNENPLALGPVSLPRSTGLASATEFSVILLSLLDTTSSGECLHLGVLAGLEKTRVFLIKPNPAGFFGFYWVFGVLLGFIGFFWVLLSLDMLSLNIKFSWGQRWSYRHSQLLFQCQ